MQTSIKYFILVCLILLSSCSLQKRLYNKGFYVAKHHVPKKTEQKSSSDTLPSILSCIKQIKSKEVPAALLAEASNKVIEIQHSKTKPTLITDGCDTLFLRNGTVMLAKILEITPEQIKFRFCDSPNEVLRIIDKNYVNYIIYATGLKEVIEYKQSDPPYYYPLSRKVNGYAIAGFALSILGVFLSGSFSASTISTGIELTTIIPFALLLITIGFCILAIIQIARHRTSQKGTALAIIGLVLSLIILSALITTLLL